MFDRLDSNKFGEEGNTGRNRRIRTSDPRLPKTVLYQAELCSGLERAAIYQAANTGKDTTCRSAL